MFVFSSSNRSTVSSVFYFLVDAVTIAWDRGRVGVYNRKIQNNRKMSNINFTDIKFSRCICDSSLINYFQINLFLCPFYLNLLIVFFV